MLVTQYFNADEKPIRGARLVGSIQSFTALHRKEYYVSHKFDTSDFQDLIQIVFVLSKSKELILDR